MDPEIRRDRSDSSVSDTLMHEHSYAMISIIIYKMDNFGIWKFKLNDWKHSQTCIW